MATSPQFTSAVNLGSQPCNATAETSWTAPTHLTPAIVTAGSNGTRIEEITFFGIGTTLAGLVVLYLYDGSTYHAFDSCLVTAVTPSTTVAPFRSSSVYSNLELKSGWSLYAGSFTASQLINVTAFGGDF